MKFDETKVQNILNLYNEGRGIVEIAKLTKTYSNNVKKIIAGRFGVLPTKCKNTIETLEQKIQSRFPHLNLLKFENVNKKCLFHCNKHKIDFEIFPKSVLKGADCPECRVENKKEKNPPSKSPFTKQEQRTSKQLSLDVFLQRSKQKFGNKFIYENYEGIRNKVTVVCPIHGKSEQYAFAHLKFKHGCNECKKLESFYTHEEFVTKANSLYNSKYSYPEQYQNCRDKITITCPNHGDFTINPYVHLQGGGCQKCSSYSSKQEKLILSWLEGKGLNVVERDRKLLNGFEIDILVDGGIGFEINGLLFHREGLLDYKINPSTNDKNRHLNKTILGLSKNVKIYHLFEDEILQKPDLVKHKILNACGINNGIKTHARKCIISKIDYQLCKKFLDKYHVQGSDSSLIRYGAWVSSPSGDGELVGVMTFRKGKDQNEFELNRYATNYNYHIRGLASKMLKRFERDFSPSTLTTFADIRWTPDSENNLYTKIGFQLIEQQPPVYHYFNPKLGIKRFNRMQFQKHKILKKYPNSDNTLSEKQLMIQLGYDRVWDCGNYKFKKTYE